MVRRIAITLFLLAAIATHALAHPSSGIVVSADHHVYFIDSGAGVWHIDPQGHLTAYGGPAYHFLAIDHSHVFRPADFAHLESGDIELVGERPALLAGSSYPIVVAADGALYYPTVAQPGRVRIMRLAAGKKAAALADLPVIKERNADGTEITAEWIRGIAAGPDGAIYYTEKSAVRRISADGQVNTLTENTVIPDCERAPGFEGATNDPYFYGLDVATDGTVYVAAAGCSAVLKISPTKEVTIALRATDRWSPQGVAVDGDTVYALEYDYINAALPRVRKLSPDGQVTVIAEIKSRQ